MKKYSNRFVDNWAISIATNNNKTLVDTLSCDYLRDVFPGTEKSFKMRRVWDPINPEVLCSENTQFLALVRNCLISFSRMCKHCFEMACTGCPGSASRFWWNFSYFLHLLGPDFYENSIQRNYYCDYISVESAWFYSAAV